MIKQTEKIPDNINKDINPVLPAAVVSSSNVPTVISSVSRGLEFLVSIDAVIRCLWRDGPPRKNNYTFLSSEESTYICKYAPSIKGVIMVYKDIERLDPALCSKKSLDLYQFPSPDEIEKKIVHQIGDELKIQVLYYLRSWLEALFDYSNKCHELLDESDCTIMYDRLSGWPLEKFVSFAKYYCAYPMAKFLKEGNPLPKRPEGLQAGGLFFSGRLKRFLKSRIVAFNDSSAGLCQTILQGVKRGTKQVPQNFVDEAVSKHYQAMSKDIYNDPRLQSWAYHAMFEEKAEQLVSRFRVKPRLYEASVSASFNMTREEGGQRQEILHRFSQIHSDENSGQVRGFHEGTGEAVSKSKFDLPSSTLSKIIEVRPGLTEEVHRTFTAPRMAELVLAGRVLAGTKSLAELSEKFTKIAERKLSQREEEEMCEIEVSTFMQTLFLEQADLEDLPKLIDTSDLVKIILKESGVPDKLVEQGVKGRWSHRPKGSDYATYAGKKRIAEWTTRRKNYLAYKAHEAEKALFFSDFAEEQEARRAAYKGRPEKFHLRKPKPPAELRGPKFKENLYSKEQFEEDRKYFEETPIGRFLILQQENKSVESRRSHWQPEPGMNLLRVKVKAIREPLKVRLITVGEAIPYYIAKYFQKAMFDHLRQFPQFQLIGSPLTTEKLDWLRSQRDKFPGAPFTFWVSGDYSAATDNLKSEYTEQAFEAFLRTSKLNEGQRDILRSVLYAQRVSYPKGFPTVVQKNGQLMGSPLSFPILCMVNLIAYWLSMEEYLDRELNIDELACLVNGDDILFPSNPEHYAIWQKHISTVGFELSQGKNYCSSRYLTVNSMLFKDELDRFKEIPYLNVGLLLGQSKLNSEQSKKDLKPAWADYNIVMRGAVDKLRAHHRFLHYHVELIENLTNQGEFNLFAHPMLGGLGFDKYPEVENRFTNFQLKLGSFLKQRLLQPREGSGIRTTTFWKGIVCKNTRKTEPVSHSFKTLVPLMGEGPLNEHEYVFEESKGTEDRLTESYEDSPPFQVKQLPQAVLKAFRKAKNIPFIHDDDLMRLDVRFIGIEKRLVSESIPVRAEVQDKGEYSFVRNKAGEVRIVFTPPTGATPPISEDSK